MNLQQIKQNLRLRGQEDSGESSNYGGAQAQEIITKAPKGNDSSDEEKEPIPWESPLKVDCVDDFTDKIIIESLTDPDTYEYTSRKAMRNFRQLFQDAIDCLEEIEFA